MPVYPKEYFETEPHVQPGSCFLLMPFAAQFDKVHSAIEAACGSPELQLSCSRADDISKPGHVMEDVLAGITKSEYIVADLTGKNPNVFYELGIAHCCKDASNVMMITQRSSDVPFDLRSMRYFTYQPSATGLGKLRGELIAAMKGDGYRFSMKPGDTYELNDMLSGQRRFLYKFKIIEIGFGASEAKFMMQTQRFVVGQGLGPPDQRGQFVPVGQAVKIAPTDWQIRLDRIDNKPGLRCAFFTISRGET